MALIEDLPPATRTVLERARGLTRTEIVRLDLEEREHADVLLAAWDLLRDRLDGAGLREARLQVRNQAWSAVTEACASLGIDLPRDDGYWRGIAVIGAGAARSTRYAACALLARDLVDPDVGLMLVGPWQRVVGGGTAR